MTSRLPPLRLLTVFDAVLRQGGVRPAAATLNVSQPAVSQALRQLEDFLGVALLDRGTRPARLTEAGRLLHTATVEGLGRIDEAVAEIGRLTSEAEGSVRIACSVGFATYWLMPRLAAFYERHPEIAVHVMTASSGSPELAAGVDIALRYGDGQWRDGAVTRLFAERIDPVASPALAERLRGTPAPLEAAPLIHVEVEDGRWTPWDAYLRFLGLPPRGRAKGLRFTNYVQATQAALGGQGIVLGWRSITGDLVAEGRLRPVIDRPMLPSDSYYMVRSPQADGKASAIVSDWLTQAAAVPPGPPGPPA
ncbi:MAG: LysR substrate-binding domain-containing protein [Kiloniellaceae bacterium]